jgi:CheY-like chemotaxis protein
MGPLKRYEIFRKPLDADPVWAESAETLEEANRRMGELISGRPADYFVLDRAQQSFLCAPEHAHCVRTLVVDDHVAVRRVVRVVLEGRFNINVVGEASNGTEAIEKVAALVPNLVVMDARMPVLDGLSAAQIIKRDHPQTLILILSFYTGKPLVELAKQLGLNGYVAKMQGGHALLTAVETVLRSGTYFCL